MEMTGAQLAWIAKWLAPGVQKRRQPVCHTRHSRWLAGGWSHGRITEGLGRP